MTVYKQHMHTSKMITVTIIILDLVSQNLTELVPSQLGIELSWVRRWDPVDVAFLEELLLLCWTLHVFMTGNKAQLHRYCMCHTEGNCAREVSIIAQENMQSI